MAEKKIAIVGTAPSSVNLAPFQDESWEIWACSPAGMPLVRVNQWFELHRYIRGAVSFPEEYCDFLAKFEGPVWVAKDTPEIPTAELFPWEELVQKYSPYFFTSTIAWMLAMAIEMNPSHIAMFGVDMGAEEEYKDQKIGCHFFALQAQMKGIDVSVPPESSLFCPAPLYGICQSQHGWIKQTTKIVEYNNRINEARMLVEKGTQEVQYLSGAKADADYQMNHWFGQNDEDLTRIIGGESIEQNEELEIREPGPATEEQTQACGGGPLPGTTPVPEGKKGKKGSKRVEYPDPVT